MVSLELTLDTTALNKYLTKINKEVGNFTPIFQQIGAYMLKSVNTNFSVEGRPNRWRKLSASTLRSRNGGKILQDTGGLKNSITYEATRTQVSIGTNIVYGKIHNDGGVIRRGNSTIVMPQRKFLLFQKEDIEAIEDFFSGNIDKALRG